jgi:flagellar motor switch protein FliM
VERILTKEEITELLSAVRHGEIGVDPEAEADEPSPPREITKIELVRVQGQGRWRVASFDIVLDAFARNFGISLTNRLQQSVSVRRTAIQTMEFDQFLQQLSGRGANAVLRLEPLRYGGVFTLDESFAFAMVEILLGGSGAKETSIPDRALTAIETNILKGVVTDACQDLSKSFRSLEELQVSLMKIVNNPRLVTIVPTDAVVMVAQFAVSINRLAGNVSVVIPLASLEPLREKLRQEAAFPTVNGGSWVPQVQEEMAEMEVDVSARLGVISLPVREILNFRVGDIINLNSDPDAPLSVLVEDKPKFLGVPGIHNGRKAVRLGNRITNGADHGKKQQ